MGAEVQQGNRMSDPVYKQTRFGEFRQFEFQADHLKYLERDRTGEREFVTGYETIGVLSPETITINTPIFVAKLYAVPVLVFMLAYSFLIEHQKIAGALFLFAVAILVAIMAMQALHVFKIRFTTMLASPGPDSVVLRRLSIVPDKNHDVIMGEIAARWKARLKTLHGQIDLSSDPARELARFSWLRDHGIIDENEFSDAVQVIRHAFVTPGAWPNDGADRLN